MIPFAPGQGFCWAQVPLHWQPPVQVAAVVSAVQLAELGPPQPLPPSIPPLQTQAGLPPVVGQAASFGVRGEGARGRARVRAARGPPDAVGREVHPVRARDAGAGGGRRLGRDRSAGAGVAAAVGAVGPGGEDAAGGAARGLAAAVQLRGAVRGGRRIGPQPLAVAFAPADQVHAGDPLEVTEVHVEFENVEVHVAVFVQLGVQEQLLALVPGLPPAVATVPHAALVVAPAQPFALPQPFPPLAPAASTRSPGSSASHPRSGPRRRSRSS